ncbi:MarR family transcriptional regulator [Sphingomonas sp. 179-I 2A4 NHS]|nr:MarR family transcriptional regulator [Sphingomonas sp. Ag1]OJU21827.1 MAG: MarR family transcriptional regulator [Sphingomonas sp. 66-10]
MTAPLLPPPAQYLRDDAIRGGMDLMFFAHRSHLAHVDTELAKQNLGRAHHRVLYFLGRHPEISVSELLDVLSVTKQSLGRVMRDLMDRGLVSGRVGERDRRQKLLSLTDKGRALENALFEHLRSNMANAYQAAGETAVTGYWIVMQQLMRAEAREQFRRLHSRQ